MANTGVRIVHNKLLGGWYVVRGPHQTPLNGRFDSKEQAQAWLDAVRGKNPVRVTKKLKRAARKMVKEYGSRARKVAGGMIGKAKTRAQREHFVGVKRALNPRDARGRFMQSGGVHIDIGMGARSHVNPSRKGWYIGTREDGTREVKHTAHPTREPWLRASGPFDSKKMAREALVKTAHYRRPVTNPLAKMGGNSRKGHVLYVKGKPLAVVYGNHDAREIARLVRAKFGLECQVGGKK